MGKKTQKVTTWDPKKKPKLWSLEWHKTESFFKDCGVELRFVLKGETKVREALIEQAKDVDYVAVLDGLDLKVFIVSGSIRHLIGARDLGKEKDEKKLRKMYEGLHKRTKLVDSSDWKAFEKLYPDKERIKELEFTAYTADLEMWSVKGRLEALKSFRYDKARKSGEGTVVSSIRYYADKKGFDHYFEFVDEVDGRSKSKMLEVFEKFLGKGAKKRVKVPSSVLKKIDESIAAGEAPDLSLARKYIVAIIDKKIAPAVVSKVKSDNKQEASKWKKMLLEANKELVELGVKPQYKPRY